MGTRLRTLIAVLACLASLGGAGNLRAQDNFGTDGDFCAHSPWYSSFGYRAMRRQGLRSQAVAALDAGITATANETVPFLFFGTDANENEIPDHFAVLPATAAVTRLRFSDTGAQPPAGAATLGDFSQVEPRTLGGLTSTLGYRVNNEAIEVSGFYMAKKTGATLIASTQVPGTGTVTNIRFVSVDDALVQQEFDAPEPAPDNDATATAISPAVTPAGARSNNRLDLPFRNAPAGFTGDNGLWLQADRVYIRLENALGSAEINYRSINENVCEGVRVDWLLGVRYVDAKEGFSLLTIDDVVSTPTTVADYVIHTDNHIIAPQVGLEGHCTVVPTFLNFGFTAKAALGFNEETTTITLRRGDGFVGFRGFRSHEGVAQVYDVGVRAEFNFCNNLYMNVGFNALWLLDVGEAVDQLDYDLSHRTGHERNNGHMTYYGPSIEFSIPF